MPDISKCNNINCPIRLTCYRFVSEPSSFKQAYKNYTPIIEADGSVTCEGFYKLLDNQDEFEKQDKRK